MTKEERIDKSVNNLIDLAKGLEKGDAIIPELKKDITTLKEKMLQILEEDERKKAQKKAS